MGILISGNTALHDDVPLSVRREIQGPILHWLDWQRIKSHIIFHKVLNRVRALGPTRKTAPQHAALTCLNLKFSNGAERAFFHRASHADLGVIKTIFLYEDYALRHLKRHAELHAHYRSILESGQTPLIIDAGSNIGSSVVFFAHHYPQAHIVCFEPNDSNFDLLTLNTKGLNVELHKAAIGSQNGAVDIVDPGEGEWGYRTQQSVSGTCPMMSISQIINEKTEHGFVPFLIKVDIEGGESNLFEAPHDWVDLFPVLIIELHDWLLPRQQTSRTFLKCIATYDRDFVHFGENLFSLKNHL